VAHFGSINEFRAALNSLVGSTGRQNPRSFRSGYERTPAETKRAGLRAAKGKKKRKRTKTSAQKKLVPRARRNMAIRIPFQGQMIEFDTPQEAAAFMREMGMAPGGAPAAPAPSPARRSFPAPPAPPVAPPSPPFMPSYTAPKKEKRGRPLARNNFLRIGKSVGGWGTLCPGLSPDRFRAEGVTATEGALRAAGVTDQMAAAVAHTMDQAGVLQKTTKSLGKEKRAIAQQIFAQMTGFTCPLAVSNRSRRNPVSWTRAY
jgi:hypothetical protein